MTMEGDSSKMGIRYVKDIPIPAKKPVSLNPMGLHVWFDGLKQPLKAGKTFPLTLNFEKAVNAKSSNGHRCRTTTRPSSIA
jgi:copper(I)-binding protein